MLRHDRIYRVLGYANICQGVSRKKNKNQAKIKINEHIRGLTSQYFIFSQKGNATHTNDRFHYMPSSNVCEVIMYVNAYKSVPWHARDYKAYQHMLGECYDMIGLANMCLGVLVMARCYRYKDVLRRARWQGMLVCDKEC